MTKAYRASGTGGGVTAPTPREAAEAFFRTWPNKRKCDIVEGESDGGFFAIQYGNRYAGGPPQSWKEITKKTLSQLPGD